MTEEPVFSYIHTFSGYKTTFFANKNRRAKFRLFFMVVAFCMATLLYFGCQPEKPVKEKKVYRPVRYKKTVSFEQEFERSFSGVARAVVESRLSFKVSGTVSQLFVNVGDKTRKGMKIAKLDPTDYRLKVQEVEASLARAQAKKRNDIAAYERVRKLYENRNASLSDLDSARAAADSSKAAVRSAEKQLQLARRQLDYTLLTAPADCAVAAVYAEVNENVQPGQPVASITCGSRLEVRVFVPETIISDINKDDKVQVVFDALPNERFPGEVTEVGVSSTGMETTFPVTVQLHAKEDRIRPGMSAEVFFQLSSDQLRSTLYVPPVAVGEDRQGRFVFTVESDDEKTGVVHKKTVQVGELTSYGMEIINGLTVGEYVVTAGIRHLSDGMKVRFNPEEKSLP